MPDYLSVCLDDGLISRISFLLVVSKVYFFEIEDNFPLDRGLTTGSYSTFLREFFLIRLGLLSLLLN